MFSHVKTTSVYLSVTVKSVISVFSFSPSQSNFRPIPTPSTLRNKPGQTRNCPVCCLTIPVFSDLSPEEKGLWMHVISRQIADIRATVTRSLHFVVIRGVLPRKTSSAWSPPIRYYSTRSSINPQIDSLTLKTLSSDCPSSLQHFQPTTCPFPAVPVWISRFFLGLL